MRREGSGAGASFIMIMTSFDYSLADPSSALHAEQGGQCDEATATVDTLHDDEGSLCFEALTVALCN